MRMEPILFFFVYFLGFSANPRAAILFCFFWPCFLQPTKIPKKKKKTILCETKKFFSTISLIFDDNGADFVFFCVFFWVIFFNGTVGRHFVFGPGLPLSQKNALNNLKKLFLFKIIVFFNKLVMHRRWWCRFHFSFGFFWTVFHGSKGRHIVRVFPGI